MTCSQNCNQGRTCDCAYQKAGDELPITMHEMPEPFEWIDECLTTFRRWALRFAAVCIVLATVAFSVGFWAGYFI